MATKKPNPPGGQGEATTVLEDPHRLQSDCAMVGRAVREDWPITNRRELVTRLQQIVDKREVAVMTRAGDVETVDGPADANAISAAKVLVAMAGQNQADRHLDDKNARLDAGKATERVLLIDDLPK